MKIKKGYKIVRKGDDGYFSASLSVFSPGAVEYKVGQWTKPNIGCGPLALFDTKTNAKNFFLFTGPPGKIFPAEYIPTRKTCLSIWKGTVTSKSLLPPGTVLASKIRLMEEEKYE